MTLPVSKRYEFCDLPIAVENAAGTIRSWATADGKLGYTRMLLDYGFIEGYLSGDGEELDVYIGPNPEPDMVYIVHQLKAPDYRKHDEDKIMLGFYSGDQALEAYLAHRDDGRRAFGTMSTIPIERFKARLRRRGSETTTKIHASAVDATRRALMLLAGRRPNERKRTVAGRKRAARYEQRLIERAVELGARALAPLLQEISGEVAQADSYPDLYRRAVRALSGSDPAKLGEVLRRTMMMARLSGWGDAREEVKRP